MNPGLELGIERIHDGSVLLEPRHAGKTGGCDANAKMRFAALMPAGMALMR